MTEFGAVTRSPAGDGGRHLGSVGRPLPGVEVRIVDGRGAAVGTGVEGEVTVAGRRTAAGVLQGANGHRPDLAGRMAAQRRSGLPGCGRLPLDHRAQQGADHPGRQQHRAARDRGGPLRPPGGGRGGRGRRRPPRPGRGRRRLGRPAAGLTSPARGPAGVPPRAARRLQGAPQPDLRRRAAPQRGGQGGHP